MGSLFESCTPCFCFQYYLTDDLIGGFMAGFINSIQYQTAARNVDGSLPITVETE